VREVSRNLLDHAADDVTAASPSCWHAPASTAHALSSSCSSASGAHTGNGDVISLLLTERRTNLSDYT